MRSRRLIFGPNFRRGFAERRMRGTGTIADTTRTADLRPHRPRLVTRICMSFAHGDTSIAIAGCGVTLEEYKRSVTPGQAIAQRAPIATSRPLKKGLVLL